MRAQKEDLLRKPTTTFYGRLPRALLLKIERVMITVVEFRAKQATGSQYLLTDKSYDNYFFIGNDLD